MKITFIGCGDAFADKLGNNSALLEFKENNLLIDIPDSNFSRIKNIGKEYSDVQNIFITHLHADHINGLERMAYYRKFATPVVRPNENIGKPNLYVPETIYHGLWDTVKYGLGVTTDGIKTLDDYFDVHLIKIRNGKGMFVIDDVTFLIQEVKHLPNMHVYSLAVQDEFYYSFDSVLEKAELYHYLTNVNYSHQINRFGRSLPLLSGTNVISNCHLFTN